MGAWFEGLDHQIASEKVTGHCNANRSSGSLILDSRSPRLKKGVGGSFISPCWIRIIAEKDETPQCTEIRFVD